MGVLKIMALHDQSGCWWRTLKHTMTLTGDEHDGFYLECSCGDKGQPLGPYVTRGDAEDELYEWNAADHG
jgi:hypothetical protein